MRALLLGMAIAVLGCDAEASPAPAPTPAPASARTRAERHVREGPIDYATRALGPIPEGRFTALDGGARAICALDEGGEIHCVGGQQVFLPPPGPFADLSVGAWHACGRRPAGNLVCWGSDFEGSVGEAPDGRFAAVAVETTSCALDSRRAPRCWGPDAHEALPPEPVRELVAGSSHTCVLTESGRIRCASADPFLASRVDLGSIPDRPFAHVFAGYEHVCGLDAEGRAECWGRDVAGETAVDPELRFTSLALGEKRSMGLCADGSVVFFGGNAPARQAGPFDAIAITGHEALGDFAFACAIRRDTRALECWPYRG